jgi:hypothetical protein
MTSSLHELADLLDRRLFFVVGCQKSGTTWVQKILDGHPHVRCHGEAYLVPLLVPMLNQLVAAYNAKHKAGPETNLDPDDLCDLFRAAAAVVFRRWLRQLPASQRAGIQAIGDKTPEHATCLPLLAQALPGARVIHIIRDPRDVVVSGHHHNLRQKGDAFRKQFPRLSDYITYTLTKHWLPYIAQARAFGATHPQHYLELRYEDLHADPASWIAKMLQLIEVEASADLVERCRSAGSFETLSAGRKEGQEDKGSFFRKGVTGDWRNHFTDADQAHCVALAGDLMRELGYLAT